MATLSKVPALVASHSVFDCNGTLTAKVVGPFYVVFSYGSHFPVAVRRRNNDAPWYINTDRYSATTSRHQSKVRQGISQHGYEALPSTTARLTTLLGTYE